EAPFLLFVLIAASHQIETDRQLKISRCLGYTSSETWLFVLLPQLYRRVRLPMLIVIAYGVTNAEIALVLGPTSPPTLTLLILEWFRDPDLSKRLIGAAGAVLAIGLVCACIAAWLVVEYLAGCARQYLVNAGRAGVLASIGRGVGWLAAILVFGLGVLALIVLVLWSFAHHWRFPEAWPQQLSLQIWARAGDDIVGASMTTLGIGLIASLVALILAVLSFEHMLARTESRQWQHPLGIAALSIPLLVPQISFVFGLQLAMIKLGLDGGWLGVILVHLLFVIPYIVLILFDPYRMLDPRLTRTARSLGHGPWTVFWRIKLPLLARPLAFAWAIGFSVSCAQYLTTLFVGQGRVVTLSLEALALMGGGDRRLTAVMALLLAVLPLLGFVLAAIAPRLLWPRLAASRLA
ncbi:MAG: ABC transporter permease subunit, partial [Pseudomonadota bacterium]